jgi:uncharacterized damage-inducible protein DinB
MDKVTAGTGEQALRGHLVSLLEGSSAHVTAHEAIRGIPAAVRDRRPRGMPHSLWQLLEHMRIAQWDILEFSTNPDHASPPWPDGYWPTEKTPTDAAWSRSLRAFRRDLGAMKKLVLAPSTDLFARIPWGSGQTILREALLIADHNAYHTGQIVILRRLLGAWRTD